VMRQSHHVNVETALGPMEETEICQNDITAGVSPAEAARRPVQGSHTKVRYQPALNVKAVSWPQLARTPPGAHAWTS
jgi:hypothetical protein